jgi:uncharacterized protein YaeQ
MGNTPFRCQVRLTISDLDRGVYGQRTIVVAQQPDEPDEHVLLRFLSHVLFFDERLQDGQGWVDAHEPDLIATDLTGQTTLWIECGTPPMKRLIKALGHNKDARLVTIFADPAEAEKFRAEVVGHRPRQIERLELYLVPPEFMHWLESVGHRSMVWTATITEGTVYLDSDGHAGECTPLRLPVLLHPGARAP